MAIFHYTVKIVGRSKGKSIISASAYLNGDVMKNEETGRISYYTSKREVVYTSLMMCENAPQEWQNVPAENIRRFQKSVRYKRADNKEAALEKFKLTFQKQRLWNEVLKTEKSADAQLGRSFEFSLPKEWSRQEQIDYTTEYIQKTFVDKGMCADWSIHDKGDGNPHVHLLVTMRPFNPDHSWGNKEIKDWDFVRDENGNTVVDESHPDWWQDKKNPDRHGIRIPVLDENGVQKVGARNRKQWKRVLTDATGWNNPKNCELWRSEWANVCNAHLKVENHIDHRSYARQGKLEIPTIHEGADARKIDEKFQNGQTSSASWKVEENQIIKRQNALLNKIQISFGKVSGALTQWKERLDDIRRKPGSHSMMETMINQIEEQQNLIAEMVQELQERDRQLLSFQEQNQSLKSLNSELSGLLNLLPDTEELLSQIEQQKTRIEQLETENQQWQELTQKLNSENSLLQKQNTELLTLNSR